MVFLKKEATTDFFHLTHVASIYFTMHFAMGLNRYAEETENPAYDLHTWFKLAPC